MPFHPPFRRQTYHRDLCYGLAVPRQDYIDNNPAFAKGVDVINNYRISEEEQRRRPRAPAHEPAFLRAVQAHPKYASIINSLEDSNEVIRRKCKAGLHWGTHDPEISHVHFLLDSLNQDEIVRKDYRDDFLARTSGGSVIKNRAITNAELRWIFRNRHDPNVREGVQFWENGEPTSPPWETDPTTWAKYIPNAGITEQPDEAPAPTQYEPFPTFFGDPENTPPTIVRESRNNTDDSGGTYSNAAHVKRGDRVASRGSESLCPDECLELELEFEEDEEEEEDALQAQLSRLNVSVDPG